MTPLFQPKQLVKVSGYPNFVFMVVAKVLGYNDEVRYNVVATQLVTEDTPLVIPGVAQYKLREIYVKTA